MQNRRQWKAVKRNKGTLSWRKPLCRGRGQELGGVKLIEKVIGSSGQRLTVHRPQLIVVVGYFISKTTMGCQPWTVDYNFQ